MNNSPLAEILRPKTLDDVLGQEHLTGKNGTIKRMLDNDTINSLIFSPNIPSDIVLPFFRFHRVASREN